MTVNRFIRLIISAINHIPHLLRYNHISWMTEIRGKSFLRSCTIGSYGYIGRNCNIQNAEIGNYVSIAPCVQIGGMEHAINDLSTNTWLSDKGDSSKKTIIGHDVWIATNCIIRQGVTIGQGVVVGANSFVNKNKDVPPYAIVVGSPAKIIRFRFDSMLIYELQLSDYYFYPPSRARRKLEEIRQRHNM